MGNRSDKILLASAASRRKKSRLKIIIIAVIGLVLIAFTLTIFSTSRNEVDRAVASTSIDIQPKQKAAYNNTPDVDEKREISMLIDVYSNGIRATLLAFPENGIYGNHAVDLVKKLDGLFDTANKSTQPEVVQQIKVDIGIAEELIDKLQADIDKSLTALDKAFLTLDAQAFNLELANLVLVAKNDGRVLLWQKKKNQVLAYFIYRLKADKAHAEQRDEIELEALRRILELGFNTPSTESRAAQLQTNIARKKYGFHINETMSYIDQDDFKLANKEIKKASKLFPDERQIIELERIISTNLQGIEVSLLIERADVYAENDQWKQAMKSYSDALSVRDSDRLAAEGYARASNILRLKEGLLDIYSNPLRLKDINVFKFAQGLLVKSYASLDRSRSLAKLYQDVDSLISSKMAPRSVFIASDGKARIKVQGVGYINPTVGKAIKLLPGKYRLYAECKGYKTKLYEVIIPIDNEITPIRIICGTKI